MPSLNPLSGSLGQKNAAHLLRRATFGPTKNEIDIFGQMDINQAVDTLLQEKGAPSPPISPYTMNSWIGQPTGEDLDQNEFKSYVLSWWVEQMRRSQDSIIEKMVLFYHTHFTTIQSRIPHNEALYHQNVLFRYYALGNFKTLAKKICLDNAMLRHLDGFLNESGRPNENFAREFFELYTIGKGPQVGPTDYTNFTETDVQEASKVLSGYGYDDSFSNPDPDCGIPIGIIKTNDGIHASRHDISEKNFSHAFQNTTIAPLEVLDGKVTVAHALDELDQLVEMIFAQPETARHICRKLYRFFVYYKIDESIENEIIEPLADTFRNNDYEIVPVLEQLLKSTHFYDQDNAEERDNNIGAIIKSPIELLLGTLRFFKVAVPDYTAAPADFYAFGGKLRGFMKNMGLDLYEPFEVAGYPAYHQAPVYNRNWISSNYLANRYAFISGILRGITPDNIINLDIVNYVDNTSNIPDPQDPTGLVENLIKYLFPEDIPQERFDYYKNAILLDTLSEFNWQIEWQKYKNSGDDTAVRVQLESLVVALAHSPEYQLC